MTSGCQYEEQVVSALASGTWPECASEALSAHVATCAECQSITAVAPLLRLEYVEAGSEADLPSSGQVWWRARVRARAEAERAAARPLFVAQAIAAASAVGALVALVSWYWPKVQASLLHSGAADSTSLGLPIWLALGAWLLLAPVALYLVFARD